MNALTTSTIKPMKGSKQTSKRVGRGNSSGKGTYAARGMKGQRSRSGGKGGLKLLGFKQSLQKVPKLRGFKSLEPKKETVTLYELERAFKDGENVNPTVLKKRGIIGKPRNGVKIVATGEINKKLSIKNCVASKKAVELIEKAGGTFTF
ncbi:50S ribosomal protein L15 [Patescibacteria group bacterium]|nr:50S ribosomal protein L15 [Patescibacteria group bacterium]MBU1895792.1 50S ribosomal protein L15 [Patescibacteria group bacterium]